MAMVTLKIGDLSHEVACRDGGEARLMQAGALIEERWASARRAAGSGGVQRTFLLTALMLADALIEAREAPPPETPADVALGRIAERLETLASALEHEATKP